MTRELRYLHIVGELRALIADGRIGPGGLLPSEAQLARAHCASRITVRRALAELKADGIVDSRQGFGWYVARAPVPQSLRDLTTIEQQIRASGHEFRREVVSFAVEPTPEALAGLLDADTVLEIRRIDRTDGQPFATATVWVAADLVTGLSPDDLERRPLSEQLGVALGGATQTITAVSATPHDAAALAVPTGAPLLRVDRTIRDVGNRKILRSEARYNPLHTEFVTELPPAAHAAEPDLRVATTHPLGTDGTARGAASAGG
jgi:GntR family transcriptional regulator